RHGQAGRAGRRCGAAPHHAERVRAAQAQRGRARRRRRAAGRQTEERSEGDLNMPILVIAEHDNHSIKAATLNTVSAAAKLGTLLATDIHVLVAGAGCGAAAEAAAKIAGVAKVRVCDAPHYEAQTAENVAELVQGLAGDYSHVLVPATSAGKN